MRRLSLKNIFVLVSAELVFDSQRAEVAVGSFMARYKREGYVLCGSDPLFPGTIRALAGKDEPPRSLHFHKPPAMVIPAGRIVP
jgi:hypothetical protein